MPDVVISYSQLATVTNRLELIVAELREAGNRADAIEAAVGSPWDRSELTDRASESEERWNTKRGNLADDLDKIREHAQGIYDGFQEYDREAATMFDTGQDAPA